MLVVLGGFLGSGRKFVAERLSESGFYYCDPSAYKLRHGTFGKAGVAERLIHPSNETQTLQLYARMLRDFPILSKMHANVVVDEGFVREKPREYFLEEAKKYFKPVYFFWFDSSEEIAQVRLKRMIEHKKIDRTLDEAKRYRTKGKNRFQPFVVPPRTFVCNSRVDIERAVDTIRSITSGTESY